MSLINYSKELPLLGDYDVVVAGAGPAGITAAVSAQRCGSKVALVERYGVIGGNLTVGHVGPILGMVGKGTMRDEVLGLLGVSFNDMSGKVGVAHDTERAKIELAKFVDCENITVFLQTQVSDVLMEHNRIRGLVVSTKEGLGAILGNVIVDCTGDGDVAFFSGAEFEKGRDDGLMQPVSLEYTLSSLDEKNAITCIGDVDDVMFGNERFLDYCAKCASKGDLPAHLAAVRLHKTTREGERRVNTTQLNRIDSTNVKHIFKAEVELRKQISIVTKFISSHLPGYEKCIVASSGDTLGVRESRRIIGEYKLTSADVISGKKFDDVVVHDAEFIIDIHNPDGAGQAESNIQYSKPYDIPYRCFIPLKIDGLLVAGRCISGTHRAHASYRVMSICLAMGQAAGVAAALSAKEKVMPRLLDYKKIQASLKKQGVELFS